MKIHTRRNSALGYLTLMAVKRELGRRRRKRSGFRTTAYVALGLVSAGLLAAVLFVVLRRMHGDAVEESSFDSNGDSEIVGEYVTAPEPAPAT
jgi:hypothetical protein